MQKEIIVSGLLAWSLFSNSCSGSIAKDSSQNSALLQQQIQANSQQQSNSKIQVALLFDTSNSMDGLIDQAKSTIWGIVNTLTSLKFQGKAPLIEIALYEYGNDGLSDRMTYIRQATPFTTDLDLISEKLFALRTNGGSEYCGAVIAKSIEELKWDDGANTMKLIYIAGNEGFNQGIINYKEAISTAVKKNVFINTIYCGSNQDGIRELWMDGALKGKGKYFNIDSDRKIEYVHTPYDDKINACNVKLNDTYISYGYEGDMKKSNQAMQDKNAESISSANAADRVISKSKGVYKNESWDLVDSYKKDADALTKLKTEELPAEFKNKSQEEIKVIIEKKAKEREQVQKEITELAVLREKYIIEAAKSKPVQDDFGGAIKSSLISFAKSKGFEQDVNQ